MTYPDYSYILIDIPAKNVLRITLNRPEKKNALSNLLRSELFDCLAKADNDDAISVMIIRGAGSCFSAGYDLNVLLLHQKFS